MLKGQGLEGLVESANLGIQPLRTLLKVPANDADNEHMSGLEEKWLQFDDLDVAIRAESVGAGLFPAMSMSEQSFLLNELALSAG